MLKHMRIGGKMALGFGLVVVLVIVVGGLAILNMNQISGQSSQLDDAYLPEVEIANKIERTSLLTMYAMRGYSLNFSETYYQEGMNQLAELKDSIEDAFDLAGTYEYLSALRVDAQTALESVNEYEQLVGQTKSVIDSISGYRDVMDTAAANYLTAASSFLKSQNTQYQQDIASGASQQELTDRMRKVFLINDAIDVANEARVLNFKAQATSDTTYFEDAIENLQAVDAIGAELVALTRLQADIDQIEQIDESRHAYIKAVTDTMKAYQELNTLNASRNVAADAVLAAAQNTAMKGIETAMGMSHAAVEKVTTATIVVIVGLVVAVIIALVVALVLTMMITRAMREGVRFAEEIAEGDLSATLEIRQRDEIGQLAEALRNMQKALQYKAEVVKQIAAGDLTIEVNVASEKDGLGKSLVEMRKSLHDLISQVQVAVEQVSAGSTQVSQSSQELSQGATEQASSLEEISSSLAEVSSQASRNADNATEANGLSSKAAEDAVDGNRRMQELLDAMKRINTSSDEIQKVVKVIDDIAFQINLLALNANVEAARAGKYGKGFAVVAEEVRNLAVRSAEAVKETTAMVEESNNNIASGTTSANSTAEQLESIVEGANKVAELLGEIALASKEQAQGVEQINSGIDQIDQVTQANTASAEESASASEELASQASQVKGMLGRFKLRTEARGFAAPGAVGTTPANQPRRAAPRIEQKAESAGNGHATGKTATATVAVNPDEVITLDDEDFGEF